MQVIILSENDFLTPANGVIYTRGEYLRSDIDCINKESYFIATTTHNHVSYFTKEERDEIWDKLINVIAAFDVVDNIYNRKQV